MVNYKDSGVDIDKADRAIDGIMNLVKKTMNRNVISGIGGFSGLYRVPGTKKVVSAGIDGVGTKLKLAFAMKKHDTIGIDCVAMNVNDVLTSGILPHIFLDYYGCGKLNEKNFSQVLTGIVEGCLQSDAVLIGGETAEMPGFYPDDEYDLAGCAIGIGDKSEILNHSKVRQNDIVIGIPSTGFHSNGFSLVRQVLTKKKLRLDQKIGAVTLGEALLKPTRIYVPEVKKIRKAGLPIKAMVHITGGGFYENIPRVIPGKLGVLIRKCQPIPEVISLIQKKGDISERDMYRTFNMGIGFMLICDKKIEKNIRKLIPDSLKIGEIVSGGGVTIC
ncbi:MAG: phosphoribosylformylglycinamidine cyclo-ligase [Candidatus Wallbacteria bacterium]|nr:phosphoribosylformylglycinamidine cyclo-ligase [Candidatus Wallbacteria bacterium]